MKIGIDLGGTKTEAAILDRNNQVLHRIRTPTPQHLGYEAIINNIKGLIHKLEADAGMKCSVGIGTPGSIIKKSGLLKYANTTCLNNKPLLDDLQQALNREIRIENDANCFSLSEAVDGAGQDYASLFGVIIGTGVGGGIVINKKILSGPNGMTGEWGHNVLKPQGCQCYCGQQGCIETFLSGPGLLKQHQIHAGRKLHSVENLVALANSGTTDAINSLDDYYENFTLAISQVVKILDPEIIVLGGGLSNINALYREASRRINRYFASPIKLNIVKNLHGDSSGVRGAAFLWD